VSEDEFAAQIAQLRVDDILAGAATTLASLAFAKLGAGDRAEAKRAIDALALLVPRLADADLNRDLGAALASLQIAWAGGQD
jgi:hypothetical protein